MKQMNESDIKRTLQESIAPVVDGLDRIIILDQKIMNSAGKLMMEAAKKDYISAHHKKPEKLMDSKPPFDLEEEQRKLWFANSNARSEYVDAHNRRR